MTIGMGPAGVVGAALAGVAEAYAGAISASLQVALTNSCATPSRRFRGAGARGDRRGGPPPDRVGVTLTDDGRPFDPLGVAEPDTALPVEERRIGGLGIYLVRRMMDEVGYQRRADRNVVSLTKYLAEEGP
jgi:hypothetical protein